MKISKIKEVKTPERGTSLSAGIDFFIPKFTESFLNELFEKNKLICRTKEKTFIDKNITLLKHERVLIPSGIKVNFEGENKALIAFNKSGISSKKGLDVLACVIDQDYQGEIHISLVNTSEDEIIISENEKIVQMIIVPIFYENVEVVKEEELWINKTLRGDGGFGSTGK